MKLAMESNDGVRRVAAILFRPLIIPDPDPFAKWERISVINDIQFKTEGMKVCRAYGVEDGKD